MHDYPRTTTWPYVVLVVALFGITLQIPRISELDWFAGSDRQPKSLPRSRQTTVALPVSRERVRDHFELVPRRPAPTTGSVAASPAPAITPVPSATKSAQPATKSAQPATPPRATAVAAPSMRGNEQPASRSAVLSAQTPRGTTSWPVSLTIPPQNQVGPQTWWPADWRPEIQASALADQLGRGVPVGWPAAVESVAGSSGTSSAPATVHVALKSAASNGPESSWTAAADRSPATDINRAVAPSSENRNSSSHSSAPTETPSAIEQPVAELAPASPPAAQPTTSEPAVEGATPRNSAPTIESIGDSAPAPARRATDAFGPQTPIQPPTDDSEHAEPPALTDETAPPLPPEVTPPAADAPVAEARRGRASGENWIAENLAKLSSEAVLSSWVAEVSPLVEALMNREHHGDAASRSEIARLSRLVQAAAELDERLGTQPNRLQLRQVAYGLRRRILLWNALAGLENSPRLVPQPPAELDRAYDTVTRMLQSDPRLEPWREFLGTAAYEELRASGEAEWSERMASLAEALHGRTLNSQLSISQRTLIERPEISDWFATVSTWLPAENPTFEFRQALERFESDPSTDNGHLLTSSLAALESAYGEKSHRVSEIFDEHYRNANLRFAVSTKLVNTVLPSLDGYTEGVQDTILGARVRGQNVSWTQLEVTPVEDANRWHVILRAVGQTQSTTTSTKGPVTLFSRGNGQFTVEKHLYIAPQGIYVTQAQAAADSGSQLLGLRTQFDEVPLVGWMLRRYALQQHDEQRHLVRREVRNRIASSAQRRLDTEIHRRLDNLEGQIKSNVVTQLNQMGLEPVLLEMSTSDERFVMRGRLASPIQPAAYTARPQAVENSVLSMQVHQSTWNNLIEQLHLAGKELSLDEVIDKLAEALHLERGDVAQELPRDVRVRFAQREPISCRFSDGRVVVSIHIAELTNGAKVWRDFTVRAYYRADVSDLNIEMIRDGNIELISDQLGFRDRVAVRGIFTKVLARDHKLQVLRDRLTKSPQLQSLVVTQLHIDHGWIGLSLGSEHNAFVATESTPLAR